MSKTYLDFPDFYSNAFIKEISKNKKWTVSTNEKIPIDIQAFKYKQKIMGAQYTNEISLVDLDELCSLLPDAANNAYFLDAIEDHYVVLDIEPKCPDNIKQKLLNSSYVYGEVSMSGKGIHLIFPLPDYIDDYPIAKKKIVLKHQKGWYEILLQHYVTFTRNMIKPSTVKNDVFDELFKELAASQTETHRDDVEISLEPKDIPYVDTLTELLTHNDYKKTLQDFYGDMSKYEYGCAGFYHFKLRRLLDIPKYKKAHKYTPNEQAWILYKVLLEKLPHRTKHETTRDGLPWLLYLSREIIAKSNYGKKENKK